MWLAGVKGHMVCVSVYSLYSDWSGGGRGHWTGRRVLIAAPAGSSSFLHYEILCEPDNQLVQETTRYDNSSKSFQRTWHKAL